ncbi:RcnB family protein [Acinetobacter boissieri]|uniref:Nickel/cobalt transporter regulator n=1 Tax=Acinetobacter boissieri TaxID=1219383 RepID=A0A1G6JJS3_9GAMM|nr:RcnB family protein [Acinetobacter boissieri]SDC19000.1 Nickel/cobalt transporter regulator [Acinetobacter boissieri]
MKKRILVTCTLNLCVTTLVFAGPGGGGMSGGGGGFGGGMPGGGERMSGGRSMNNMGANYSNNDDLFDDLQERRRAREERGFQRLKQLKWKTGYTIPQHYQSDRYKVSALAYNLPQPQTTQQWYKINSDFVLVDAKNTIVDVR